MPGDAKGGRCCQPHWALRPAVAAVSAGRVEEATATPVPAAAAGHVSTEGKAASGQENGETAVVVAARGLILK